MPMGDSGPRWLTVSPKGQPDLELVLAELTPGPMFDAETAEGIRSLVERGAFGIGVFETDDIQGDYERPRRATYCAGASSCTLCPTPGTTTDSTFAQILAMREEIPAYFPSNSPVTASAGTARPSSASHSEGWLPVPMPRSDRASSEGSLRRRASIVRRSSTSSRARGAKSG